ncbi:MAG: ABC transporter ATP-binding protein, partial [Flavobacteriia bacterium]|nr:ABC transporter ATP-binding protein [Flavobacteriia bacterium]
RDMHYQFVAKLSGGEKRRLKLLRVLMSNPNFLVLDEPTNDLDIFAMAALEAYLSTFQGCLVVISHDRYFMDKITDHLFVFKGEGEVEDILGNYSEYRKNQRKPKEGIKAEVVVKERAAEEKRKLSYKEQQEIKTLEREIAQLETEKDTLTQQLSEGNLSNDALINLGETLGKVVESLDEKSTRWLILAELQ